jgi:DNA-binding response OmpR family regulator
VIILTACGTKEDRVRGLTLGADDDVVKPFALDELLARVHAVLRRTRPRLDQIRIGATTVDNFIVRLRHKLEPDPHHPRCIRTAHGDGYRLTITD